MKITMKRLLFSLLFLLGSAFSQNGQVIVGNYGVNYVLVAPAGSCNQNNTIQEVMGPGTVYSCQSNTWAQVGGAGGAGTVTSFSSGNLSPLFTTSVATATTTPALTFALTNAGAGTVLGNSTGAAASPAYTSTPVLGLAGTTVGTLGFANATSGSVTLAPVTGALGAVTVSLPAATGTVAVSATAPITESAAGAVGCATCTTNAAALASNAVVLGGGAQAAATNTAFTTNGTTTMTVGVAGGGNGILALAGNTSGTATLTAPAVAGTSTNPLAFSNDVSFPNGTSTTPAMAPAGGSTSGFGFNANLPSIEIASVQRTTWGASQQVFASDMCSVWTNSTTVTTAGVDTGACRSGAGVIAFGNGTAANETALLRTGMPCRITAAVSLTVGGGSQTVCSWSLPASAKTWYWECNGTYNVSAGTTPTFGIGMNASQAPTSETGNASIDSTLTGTSTQNSATSTSSGNQSILTGGTLTTITNAWWSSFGTIQASATAGTFAVTAIVNGTSAVGQVNVGSGCTLN